MTFKRFFKKTRLIYIYKIISKLFLLSVVGCASGSIFLDSSPQGSSVYLKPLGGEFQEIGLTPLTKSLSDLVRKNNASDAVLLEIRKEGYVSEQIIITDIVTRSDLKVIVSLSSLEVLLEKEIEKKLAERKGKESPVVGLLEFNEVIDKLFEVQRLVKVGRSKEALKKLDEVQKLNNQLAVVYEMQGGIAYLEKDYITAYDAYRLAVKYNPKNLESLSMRTYLKNILEKQAGGRLPSKK